MFSLGASFVLSIGIETHFYLFNLFLFLKLVFLLWVCLVTSVKMQWLFNRVTLQISETNVDGMKLN